MKVILVAVISLDGKLTNGNDPDIYKWTSKEDQFFFFNLLDNAKVVIMGSATYETARNIIKHKEGRLRIVLTSNPGKYAGDEVPGFLEFKSETPFQLINQLENYEEILLVGGSKIYTSFLKEGLIDEIYLTIEPIVFGEGKPLFVERPKQNLILESMQQLNKTGTILLKYKLQK